jgi:hypothetical protein
MDGTKQEREGRNRAGARRTEQSKKEKEGIEKEREGRNRAAERRTKQKTMKK